MPAFRSVMSVLLRELGEVSLHPEGQPYELTRFVMRADLTGLLYDVPVE
jgi:hypothetical protein